MLGMAITFSAFTFLPGKKIIGAGYFINDSIVVKEIQLDKKPEPPKEKIQPAPAPSEGRFISSFLMVQKKDSAEKLNDITKLQIGSKTIITNVPSDIYQEPGDGGQ